MSVQVPSKSERSFWCVCMWDRIRNRNKVVTSRRREKAAGGTVAAAAVATLPHCATTIGGMHWKTICRFCSRHDVDGEEADGENEEEEKEDGDGTRLFHYYSCCFCHRRSIGVQLNRAS